MTKGVAVILGPTGRNFAAGMSGGIAFVLDEDGTFHDRCNTAMVELEPVSKDEDIEVLRTLIENHVRNTDSPKAMLVLADWDKYLPKFVKIMPTEYRLALERLRKERAAPKSARGVGRSILPAGASNETPV
jgi:glutamate synthase domain-containing protein 3